MAQPPRNKRLVAGFVGFSLLVCVASAQEPAPAEPAQQEAQNPPASTEPSGGESTVLKRIPKEDPAAIHAMFHRSLYLSAKRGAHWLRSMQRPDGLFVYGWIPALNRPLPGDNFLRQAGAAAALARAAAATSNPELALSARQATVVLLASYTQQDPENAELRKPTLPPGEANPVGFAGLLLLAISELPAPGEAKGEENVGATATPSKAVYEHADRLGRFIASRQRPDGSINVSASLEPDGQDPPEGIDYFPGEALYALMRSYPASPAPWKLETVHKALPYYQKVFQENPSMAFVPWQSGAMTEAFFLTKDRKFSDFVFAMNDWLIQMQYFEADGVPTPWVGGFGGFHAGHKVRSTPGAATASYCEGLVEACRVAKAVGDEKRLEAYENALRMGFLFLMGSQYSITEAPYFERWYSQKLNGAFYASVEDGNVRIDYAQHAVCAMLHYLNHIVAYENPDVVKRRTSLGAPTAN